MGSTHNNHAKNPKLHAHAHLNVFVRPLFLFSTTLSSFSSCFGSFACSFPLRCASSFALMAAAFLMSCATASSALLLPLGGVVVAMFSSPVAARVPAVVVPGSIVVPQVAPSFSFQQRIRQPVAASSRNLGTSVVLLAQVQVVWKPNKQLERVDWVYPLHPPLLQPSGECRKLRDVQIMSSEAPLS